MIAMRMEKAEKKFEEYREHLKSEAGRWVRYIKLYHRLNERREDRLAEMNIAPCFFQVTIDALFSVIILWVDKLFGYNAKRGFVNFLSFITTVRLIIE